MALTTAEQLRACHVRRWHIVQTSREQTLAEHSYAVAVIAGTVAARIRWTGLLHDSNQLRLVQWALSHDMIEVRTGDMPTPFKRALEQVAGPGVVERAEDVVDRDMAGAHRKIRGTEVEMIVKLADQIEAIYFLQDNGVGAHARQVLDGLRAILAQMVNEYEKQYPALSIRAGVREVVREVGIDGGWL